MFSAKIRDLRSRDKTSRAACCEPPARAALRSNADDPDHSHFQGAGIINPSPSQFQIPRKTRYSPKRKRKATPRIFHSDQGSEYASTACIEWLVKHNILPSHSPKGKPWVNGRQELFFSSFKLEFGKASRFPTLEKLIEGIGQHIFYYNFRRIHSALKMPPKQFCDEWKKTYTPEEKTEPEGV